ncbi:MAG: 50S ribosomal protein L18, partial [Rhizobiales bacterium]|nr:50S ribosomal protein L18 [Hyphomicrobiales bacterium]
MATVRDRTLRRRASVRRTVKAAANGRVRLSVHRSGKHIYAQVIDDVKGATLASASTLEKDLRGSLKTGANVDAAKAVGKLLATRAIEKG